MAQIEDNDLDEKTNVNDMSNTDKHAVKAIYDNLPTDPKQLEEYLNLLSDRTASNDFNYYKSAILSDFVTVETRFPQPIESTGTHSILYGD